MLAAKAEEVERARAAAAAAAEKVATLEREHAQLAEKLEAARIDMPREDVAHILAHVAATADLYAAYEAATGRLATLRCAEAAEAAEAIREGKRRHKGWSAELRTDADVTADMERWEGERGRDTFTETHITAELAALAAERAAAVEASRKRAADIGATVAAVHAAAEAIKAQEALVVNGHTVQRIDCALVAEIWENTHTYEQSVVGLHLFMGTIEMARAFATRIPPEAWRASTIVDARTPHSRPWMETVDAAHGLMLVAPLPALDVFEFAYGSLGVGVLRVLWEPAPYPTPRFWEGLGVLGHPRLALAASFEADPNPAGATAMPLRAD